MRFFYDGQIRRYVVQMIRMLSGFKYQSSDGIVRSVPVMFGDMSRQAANIMNNNSENTVQAVPRIAVYITGLELDRSRLRDQTFVSKMSIRERAIDENGNEYLDVQGRNYTVERIMPTPYKMTLKADIYTSNTEQKLQILEQILVLFNPSLELQTTDNYIDWTSLSVVNLNDINYTSKSIPVGTDDQPDISTLNFDTPIWISAPAKIKKLGIITNIITNIFDESEVDNFDFQYGKPMSTVYTTIGGFDVLVWANEIKIVNPYGAIDALSGNGSKPIEIAFEDVNWNTVFDFYPNKFRAGVSQIFLNQQSGNRVIGTVSIDDVDPTKLLVSWDQDTYPTNTLVKSTVFQIGRGTIDAIIDPTKFDPRGSRTIGTRYMILDNIGSSINTDGADAWKNDDGTDFIAAENDLIEWTGSSWEVVLEHTYSDQVVYTTNLKTGIQYKLEDGIWIKSFDGEYKAGEWQLIL